MNLRVAGGKRHSICERAASAPAPFPGGARSREEAAPSAADPHTCSSVTKSRALAGTAFCGSAAPCQSSTLSGSGGSQSQTTVATTAPSSQHSDGASIASAKWLPLAPGWSGPVGACASLAECCNRAPAARQASRACGPRVCARYQSALFGPASHGLCGCAVCAACWRGERPVAAAAKPLRSLQPQHATTAPAL